MAELEELPSLTVARLGLFEAMRQARRTLWIEATGDSMRPLIRPGTWLRVDFGAFPRERGEILVAVTAEGVVAHRLVDRRHGRLLLKGDANGHFDSPVEPEDVLGVVTALRRAPRAQVRRLGCRGVTARAAARVSWLRARLAT